MPLVIGNVRKHLEPILVGMRTVSWSRIKCYVPMIVQRVEKKIRVMEIVVDHWLLKEMILMEQMMLRWAWLVGVMDVQ